jgi:pimeloyl-ACP methyl ester carboxylesterase
MRLLSFLYLWLVPMTRNIWKWQDTHDIHYESYVTPGKTNLVLIHGFGASSYHWRHNVNELAKHYSVFAIDLIGFGSSAKPILEYTADLWKNQTVDFVRKIYAETNQPVVLIGNSLGGYTAMYAATDEKIRSLVQAIILLNPVGVFRGQGDLSRFSWLAQKPLIMGLYYYLIPSFSLGLSRENWSKTRIRSILQSVYPYHSENVDDALVESIIRPALHPNASAVFYSVIKNMFNYKVPANADVPTYILMGKKDPWIYNYDDFVKECSLLPNSLLCAFDMRIGAKNYPYIFGKWLDAGHCPHDETPELVNAYILSFLHIAL